jgi:sigma-E factor negative regulatory protein RseA
VALVAWLALSMQMPGGAPAPQARLQVPLAAPAAVNDYMLAHQEFSPSTAMRGVASYVRTVSAHEADPAR